MAASDYKFKFYDRVNPLTGNKEYQALMMGNVDGKDITYRTSFHRSRDMMQNEINRAIGTISATQSDGRVQVSQDYGSRKLGVGPSESFAQTLEAGGKLEAPETFEDVRYEGGLRTAQTRSQTGIRKAPQTMRAPANMLDPTYDPTTDTAESDKEKAEQLRKSLLAG